MRRLLPILAGLAALSCATSSAPAKAAKGSGLADPAAVRVPPGFEKVQGEILTEYDLTHDGKPDVWKYTLKDPSGKEILLRKEKDLNGDGKIDTWEKYAPDGSLVRVVYDLDFDGKPDVTLYFEKDQLVKKEMAFGFDGVPRTWFFYEKGKLVRKERDTNGDGNVDVWEYWENGEIDRIGYDTDGDGQVDRWEARKTSAAGASDQAPQQGANPAAAPAPGAPAQK